MNAAARPRLLIVDDEAAQMTALCNTLEDRGYVTTGFTSAKEALAVLRGQQFDLVLTDLMMPEMDGIALLRAAPSGARPPRSYCSSATTASASTRATWSGSSGFPAPALDGNSAFLAFPATVSRQ
jgi:CheY-like chemotaxis protein